MAQDNKIRMPSSMGGLVNYSDEYTSKFMLKPEHVLILIGVITLVILLLHWQGYGLFGLAG